VELVLSCAALSLSKCRSIKVEIKIKININMKYLSILVLALLFQACGAKQDAAVNAPDSAANSVTPTPVSTPAAAQTPPAQAGDLQWLSIMEVQEKVKKEPRKILVDVYTGWCGPCKMMMATTFKDPALIAYLEKNYYTVKFNGESGETITFNGKEYKNPQYNASIPETRRNAMHEFTGALGLRGYPTLFIFDPKLNKITESVGMKSAEQLMEVLKQLEG
jgi:thioredoxin-related protein